MMRLMIALTLTGLAGLAYAEEKPDNCAIAAERSVMVLSKIWDEQGKLPADYAEKRPLAVAKTTKHLREAGEGKCLLLLMMPETSFEAMMKQSAGD